jgi:hypothetical protein
MLVNQALRKNIMRYWCCLMVIITSAASSAQSGQFCFAAAESYYEQVYCQLQAKAQIKNFPPFHQFRKNNEEVQYSLLKRPAERNAIKLPAPARKAAASGPRQQISAAQLPTDKSKNKTGSGKIIARETKPSGLPRQTPGSEHGCRFAGKELICDEQRFYLLGNKANHRLAKQALSPGNKMDLPQYTGGNLHQYLATAYRQYIAKMCEIGLCGVTMTYGKFAYLYQDLHNKGLDFAQRFETMFSFLKKDKASLGVSEAVNLPQGMEVNDCAPLGKQYFVCDYLGRNYIFASQ